MRLGLGMVTLLFALLIHTADANSIDETCQDFLELTITTSASDKSLEKAIALARQKAEKIKELEEDVCRRLIKDKSECKGSAEIGNVDIKPKYETNKKLTTFQKITASFTILIKVQHVQKFGELVDQILKMEGFVIEKIEWIPDEDQIQETFLTESVQKSRQLCSELDQNLIRIVQVEELREEPEKPQEEEQPAEGEEEQEQQQQEQPEEQPEQEEEVTKYRITVECGGKKQSKKGKKAKTDKK